MTFLVFMIGVFVGGIGGVFVMALAAAAGRGERYYEWRDGSDD
jgi:hypothetical protein